MLGTGSCVSGSPPDDGLMRNDSSMGAAQCINITEAFVIICNLCLTCHLSYAFVIKVHSTFFFSSF